jgi:YD repeat-containing protein
VRGRRSHGTFIAIASLAATVGAGAPQVNDGDSQGVDDLYRQPPPIAPYQTIVWESTDSEGRVETLTYDAGAATGVINSTDGSQVQFEGDEVYYRPTPNDPLVPLDEDGVTIIKWFWHARLLATIEDVLPPEAWPYIAVHERRDEMLAGKTYDYLSISVDVDAFRADVPSIFWPWWSRWQLQQGDVMELWFAGDGVLERTTYGGATQQLVTRTFEPAETQPSLPAVDPPTTTLGSIEFVPDQTVGGR